MSPAWAPSTASHGAVLMEACAVQTLVLLFSVDDLTGFEITYLLELPQPWGIFVVWGLVLPLVYIVASSLTNLVLRDFLILKVSHTTSQEQYRVPLTTALLCNGLFQSQMLWKCLAGQVHSSLVLTQSSMSLSRDVLLKKPVS